jgi:uncharacterized low-complexity protein
MSQKSTFKPLTIAMGAAFATSLAGTPVANASDNPFAMSEIAGGYMVASSHMEGKCGEGKCGGKMMKEGADKAMKEGKCGEGKCGMKMMDADGDGKVTKDEFMSAHEAMFSKKDKNADGSIDAKEMEGKCGEGKCGGKMMKEGAGKTMKEGKCGEGKCGGNK